MPSTGVLQRSEYYCGGAVLCRMPVEYKKLRDSQGLASISQALKAAREAEVNSVDMSFTIRSNPYNISGC